VQFNHPLGLNRLPLPLVLLATGVVLPACNESSVKLYPVKGQVLFKEQPANGAQVVFQLAGDDHAQDQGPRPAATVAPDGSFTLRTEPHGAGAPPGEYVVLVTWYPPDGREQANPKNRLPIKYANPGRPLLKATVKEGRNELEPFRLAP
jgi:hypothetical protein